MSSYLPLLAAVTLFVGGHFLLAADGVRPFLVGKLGARGFQGVYSLVAFAGLAATVLAFRAAPLAPPLWSLGGLGRHLAMGIMPLSLILVVLGVASPSPTMMGGEKLLEKGWQPKGVVTLTRHPFLWGTGLWSIAHLLANGDTAAVILFGGMAILSFGGMAAIDGKRAREFGAAWQLLAKQTSRLPFAGATPVDWRGIGWIKPLIGLVLYGGIVAIHGWAFNKPLV